jgi:hypothetical protein
MMMETCEGVGREDEEGKEKTESSHELLINACQIREFSFSFWFAKIMCQHEHHRPAKYP